MGSSPVIPHTWRVGLIGQGSSGLKAEMTFAVNDETVIRDAARAAVIAAPFKTWWNTSIKPVVAPSWSLVQIYVLDVNSPTGTSIEYLTGLPIAGTSGSAAGAANAAPIITWRTDLRGRSFRGRSFVWGCALNMYSTTDGTLITPVLQTSLTTAAGALITAIAAISVPDETYLAVASNKLLTNTPIVSGECRTYVGTQQRRVSSP